MAEAIAKRDQIVKDNLAQKDALLREIHHRVKNNLQVITSLLNLQQRALADPAGRAVLADTRQRISALALIYRALYQSEDLRRVDVRSFLEELVGQLVNSEGPRDAPVRATVEADELMLDPDKLAPFALFAVEAVTNAQKHAFPAGGGALAVRFRVQEGEATLEVQDDGVGADPEAMQGGVGRTLMTAFARQLRGKMAFTPGAGGGVTASLTFPVPDVAPASVH
jgi:two-component sensor histidine kinase